MTFLFAFTLITFALVCVWTLLAGCSDLFKHSKHKPEPEPAEEELTPFKEICRLVPGLVPGMYLPDANLLILKEMLKMLKEMRRLAGVDR